MTGEFTPIFNNLGRLTTFAYPLPRSQFLPLIRLTRREKTAYGGRVPSPVGHVLGGAIVGLVVVPSAVRWCLVAAAAPDLDFLWGRHNMETHSLGAAAAAGLLVFA